MTKNIFVLMDYLVSGDSNRWPAASRAVGFPHMLLHELGDTLDYTRELGARLVTVAPAMRSAFLADEELENPRAFQAMLAAIYRVYYTSPAVVAAIEDLADEGPREPSPQFDPTLVAQVLARRAGQRRL